MIVVNHIEKSFRKLNKSPSDRDFLIASLTLQTSHNNIPPEKNTGDFCLELRSFPFTDSVSAELLRIIREMPYVVSLHVLLVCVLLF